MWWAVLSRGQVFLDVAKAKSYIGKAFFFLLILLLTEERIDEIANK